MENKSSQSLVNLLKFLAVIGLAMAPFMVSQFYWAYRHSFDDLALRLILSGFAGIVLGILIWKRKEFFPDIAPDTLVYFGLGLLFAVLLRNSFLDFVSKDYTIYLSQWYDFIRSHGGFRAQRYTFADYNPPYLYLLTIASYLPIPKLYAVKLFSILGDFAAATLVFLIVRLKYPRPFLPLLAFFTVLYAPTVFFNSALWGQCDVLYTTGLLATLYFILGKRPSWAMAAFGTAVAFKLQAVFLFPLILMLVVKKKINWKQLLWIPAAYALWLLPAFLLGRPLKELTMVYLNQAGMSLALNLSAPTVYLWLPNDQQTFVRAGLAFASMIVATFCYICYRSKVALHRDLLVKLALASVLIVPYTLPKMHERYFFAADVFSIVYAFYFPRYFYVPLLVSAASLFSYFPFLFHREVFSLLYLALIMGIAVVIVGQDLIRSFFPGRSALRLQ